MTKKQLSGLFICNLVVWSVIQAIGALLPVYAVRLGADPASIGNFLAFTFFALTLGAMASGWLSNRFQRRRLCLVVAGVLNIFATWMMGQAVSFWQLVIVAALVHFLASLSFSTIAILTGMFAGPTERGKIFGILGINMGLGALLGGTASGAIVDRWGFPTMFLVVGLAWIVLPLAVIFLQDKNIAPTVPQPHSSHAEQSKVGGAFYLILVATMIASACGFVGGLGRPLQMDRMGFDPSAISGAVAIGGAFSIPVPVLLGWLSDRIGRYPLVALCFFIGAVGLAVLAISTSLWHFWVASILLTWVGASMGIGQAIVVDLVATDYLGTALAQYGSAPTIGGIIGFAGTGYAIEAFGLKATYVAAAAITLVSVALLIWVQHIHVAERKLA